MQMIFGLLASLAGIYSLLIFIRIIISWFGDTSSARPVQILQSITDPYLDWWRRFSFLRIGFLDFSPILGIAALSVLQTVLHALSNSEIISIGSILAVVLLVAWSIVSFLLVLCIIVLGLRLICFFANGDLYSPFWKAIDTISKPILYRLNRLFFGNRIESFIKGILFSLLFLAGALILGNLVIKQIAGLIQGLPF